MIQGGDKQKTSAIGSYLEISLQEARDRKMEACKLLAQGIDPSEHKKSQARGGQVGFGADLQGGRKEFLVKCEA